MDSPSGNFSPIKNTICKARRELNSSPLKLGKRRKSSIPLQLVEFINQMKPESASKKSYKGDCSNKNHLRKMINTSIPEESENSSIKENKNNNKKERKEKREKKVKSEKRERKDKSERNEKSERKDKKDKKNEIENNNYYIHYIKNVYENESHLNKDNLFKSANKNDNINETLMNFLESNKNIKPVFKRRNSAMNRELFKSNLMNKNNLFLDKIQINSKLPESIINKKKSGDILLHKKKDIKEKENSKSHYNNTGGNKNKSKNKNKDKKKYKDKNKTKEKDKNKDSNEENNINTENQKKNIKEKEILENEKKTETENIIENTKIKKINKFKKFLCCFINNGDDSIEND